MKGILKHLVLIWYWIQKNNVLTLSVWLFFCCLKNAYPQSFMKYFKTDLPVAKIKDDLHAVRADADEETCIVEIENKRSIIVTISESISEYLQKDRNFRNIELSDTDISVIKIIHRILSVSGNKRLFGM